MTKLDLQNNLVTDYLKFTSSFTEFTKQEFEYSYNGKWHAGQQLQHLILSIKPLVKAFGTPKEKLAQLFGTANRKHRELKEVLSLVEDQLPTGIKAPEYLLPENIKYSEKVNLQETLHSLIYELSRKIDHFSENELDKYCLKHPVLGLLTLREMLENALFHVEHHHRQIVKHLEKLKRINPI